MDPLRRERVPLAPVVVRASPCPLQNSEATFSRSGPLQSPCEPGPRDTLCGIAPRTAPVRASASFQAPAPTNLLGRGPKSARHSPGRNMGTKWTQRAPTVGQGCVVMLIRNPKLIPRGGGSEAWASEAAWTPSGLFLFQFSRARCISHLPLHQAWAPLVQATSCGACIANTTKRTHILSMGSRDPTRFALGAGTIS